MQYDHDVKDQIDKNTINPNSFVRIKFKTFQANGESWFFRLWLQLKRNLVSAEYQNNCFNHIMRYIHSILPTIVAIQMRLPVYNHYNLNCFNLCHTRFQKNKAVYSTITFLQSCHIPFLC